MRIVEVHAHAFGPLRDARLRLAPGMNVLYGPNEAGKSSWHAALYAGLCGMKRGRGAQSKEDKEFDERHRPWEGAEWAVTVRLSLADGASLEVHQDLADLANCRAIDLTTGREVTPELLNDGTPDGARLLGLTRRTLPPTLSIRQAEVLRVLENPGELQEQLQRAAATAGADQTAEAAIERIKKFHGERVGGPRARTRPLPVAAEQAAATAAAAEEARRRHEEYLGLVERLEAAAGEAEALERRLAAARRRQELRRLASLRARVARARELDGRLPEQPPPDPAADRALHERIGSALEAFDQRPAATAPPAGATAEELQRQLAGLPEAPRGDLEPAPEVAAAEEAWRRARGALAAHDGARPEPAAPPEGGGLTPGELRGLAETLARPLPAVDPELERRLAELPGGGGAVTRHRGLWAAAGILLATAGGVLLAYDLTIPGILALGAGALVLVFAVLLPLAQTGGAPGAAVLEARLATQRDLRAQAEKALEDARERLRQAGLPADPAALRSRADAVETADADARALGRWGEQRRSLEAAEAAAAVRLRSALAARPDGAADASAALDDLLQRYRAECQERKRQAENAARRGPLEEALAARRSAEQAAAETLQRRRAAELRLWEAAAKCGVEAGDLERAAAGLRSHREELAARLSRLERQGRDWAALQQLLDGRTRDDLEAELARLEARLPAAPDDDPGAESDAELEAAVAALESGRDEARRLRDHLAGQVADRERHLPQVAAAEEAAEEARAEQARLEGLGTTLRRAQEFLEAARDRVQRDIAPRLKAAIEARLSRVTGGRYQEALVDPGDLTVKIRPRGGAWRPAALHSHGTAEQVYLLLRLALAEALVKPGEPAPLFLDDATVQSDAARTAAILDLLHEISRQHQVIVFSQEDEVLAWAKETLTGPQDQVLELP
jgi:DNA repair protein SbcC/Rad50